jgi:hypothetical protein
MKPMANQETNAMADILNKLNNVKAGKSIAKGVASSDQTSAMADVLRKLQAVSATTTQELVTESKRDPILSAAVNTVRSNSVVSVARYDIQTKKKTVQEGLTKTFYYVVDNKTKKIIHRDLGLFETAMGIVKHMLYTGNESRINILLNLDQEYVGAMMETYSHKTRLKRLDESTIQYDVTSAKYSNSKQKVQAAKMKLLKAL